MSIVKVYPEIECFCLSIKLFCVIDSEQTSAQDPLENTPEETKEMAGESWP